MNNYKHWILENQKAVNVLLEQELDYWVAQVDGGELPERIEAGIPHSAMVKVPVGRAMGGVALQNITITAILYALHELTLEDAFVIYREGHGRNALTDYDVSDTIGWFTCKYPTKYRMVPGSISRTLEGIAAANNAVPNGGVGFDVLKYYGPVYINRQLECADRILFNYLGDIGFNTDAPADDRLLLSAHSGFAATFQGNAGSLYALNINAWLDNKVLHCQLAIAPEMGLDSEKGALFITLVQQYIETLLVRDKAAEHVPVTPFQRGLISYVFNHPENKSYINQNSFETTEDISFSFLREVCRLLTTKYEILRTCYDFDYNTGEFIATVLPAGTLNCEYFEAGDTASLQHLLIHIKQQGFDIAREPLIRFSLIRTGNGKCVVVITSHHIIIDGTSVMHIFKELLDIADRLRAGKEVITTIPEELKFSTYARWISGKNEQEALTYWKTLLSDVKPTLLEEKTTGETEFPENPFSDLELHFDLNAGSLAVLKSQHITLAAALNYITGFILSRYCGKDAFIWGNTVTVRPFELNDMETIIGPCISTIPVKMHFNTGQSLLEGIKALQIQLIESQEYAYLSLNDIARAAGHAQLFSVSYVYQNFIRTGTGAGQQDLSLKHLSTDANISSHFPVNLLLVEGDGQLGIKTRYRNDNFTSHLVKDICQAIVSVFNRLDIVKSLPDNGINVFEAGGLKSSRLQGNVPAAGGSTLHGAFMKAAAVFPDRIAVRDISREVTYRELNAMSNRIFELLTRHDISGAVGVRMKRSVNLIAVIIGALKAGCHIVSLEHDFPDEKVEWIHKTIGLSAVFTDMDTLLKTAGRVFAIGQIDPLESYEAVPHADPSSLCCINYTSGSTGVPKLVKIDHTGHMNRVSWLSGTFPATAEDTYGFKTLLCFGPSLREVFEPLAQGSTLFVYSNESNNNPALFHEQTTKYKVSRLFLTPTFLRLLYDCELQEALAPLRYLEISGEPIAVTLFERLKKDFPQIRIVGRYGATEAPGTVYFTGDNPGSRRNLPLGRPIQHTAIAVLDEHRKILPVGIIGEIGITGESISTGYINKELETDSFVEVDGERYVKTGDLGYVNHEGILIFQSRKTRMVKIRGFRVEPTEIEFNLTQHPALKKAIVVPVVSSGNTRITAFYMKNSEVTGKELRSFLEKKIPPYMIPHEFTEIDAVPLTDSGKVDFVKLAQRAGTKAQGEMRPPEAGIEKDLYNIISSLLDNRPFDILSNFFEIGMDSILALKAVYRIRKQLAPAITVTDLYLQPTIKELAAFITRRPHSSPANEERFYFINYNEQNELLFFVLPIGNTQFDINTLEKAVPGHVTLVILRSVSAEDAMQSSIEKIAADYIQLIEKINKGRKVHISGWSLGATIAYEIAVQLEKAGTQIGAVLLFDPGFYLPEYDMNLTKEKLGNILDSQLEGSNRADAEIRERILTDMLGANQLIVHYKPGTYRGTMQLFKPVQIREGERNYSRPQNGLQGDIHITSIEGNHMNMLGNAQRNKQIIQEFILQEEATR
ncbi:condensation domain-containing protein [Chitinophaga sp. GbtcB8]|uniref:condensation domain-containing protein n=1 Tax=Chitinophaga sp. GbtcB8 TaxID=2824753 RepID=UPI001C2F98B7|nr:condensation domain-containing protein [Chitinophaga sp. GbtcB8]